MAGFADLTEGQRMYGLVSVSIPAAVAASITHSAFIGLGVVVVGSVLGILATAIGGFLCRTDHRNPSGGVHAPAFDRCFLRTYYTAPAAAASYAAWHLVENGLPF